MSKFEVHVRGVKVRTPEGVKYRGDVIKNPKAETIKMAEADKQHRTLALIEITTPAKPA